MIHRFKFSVITFSMILIVISIASMQVKGETSSSSYLKNNNIYVHNNLFDRNLNTAWVEGADDEGIGEWVLEKFDGPELINDIGIFNGYQKSTIVFKANNRVKDLEILLSDGTKKVISLKDEMGVQWITLNKETRSIRFKILSVYKGNKYNDTCLTEVVVNYRSIWVKINNLLNNYVDKKVSLADLYSHAKIPGGWTFFGYISIDKKTESVKAILDLYLYNEKNSKRTKNFDVFVAESCREAISEKIIKYPYSIIPFIDKKYLEQLKLIIREYDGLKNNYMRDVKGMKVVSESLRKFYSSNQNDPKIKKIFKGAEL